MLECSTLWERREHTHTKRYCKHRGRMMHGQHKDIEKQRAHSPVRDSQVRKVILEYAMQTEHSLRSLQRNRARMGRKL